MAIWGALFVAVAIAGRTCAALVFLLAAVQKLRHWRLLSGVIANYRLMPRWSAGPAAALLPPVELLLGIALLLAPLQPWSAVAGIVLLLLFAGAMAINVARGRIHIDCGCGQEFLAQKLGWPLVARNLALVALLAPSLAAPVPAALSEIWVGAAAGLGCFLLYLMFNLFAALPAPGARRFA
jgi:hypothetical protein